MREYAVIYERGTSGSWGAYAPDLPGLGVWADTREEVEALIRGGIRIYLEELAAEGKSVPEPSSFAGSVAA
jgi:predicted RNase H-like HicB family nuclease